MSNFIDKLKRRIRSRTQPIGFRPSESAKTPALLLVLQAPQPEGMAAAAESHPDALLVNIENPDAIDLPGIVRAAGDTPVGCSLSGAFTEEKLKRLLEAGCDFLVFEPANMPVRLLAMAKTGKVLKVELSLPNGTARAVDQLEVDAVLVSPPKEGGLSINDLLAYHHLSSLITRPLFTWVNPGIDASELEALRDARIEGIFISSASKEEVERIRHIIESLPHIRRKPPRPEAVLPPPPIRAREMAAEEEEEAE